MSAPQLPVHLEYPIIAIGDLHGRAAWLKKLASKLAKLPEWSLHALSFSATLWIVGNR